jgi:deazaflavin-dependent oxidoreductase (nitroreductase family)
VSNNLSNQDGPNRTEDERLPGPSLTCTNTDEGRARRGGRGDHREQPAQEALPPPWFIHMAWRAHRALYRVSGGRFLWTTSNKRGWGALRLTTTGRKSGVERNVIVGYIEDGPNLVTLAKNGWDEGHPAWWLNLEAHPDAVVRLARQRPRPVHARATQGKERYRLWLRWTATDERPRRLRPSAVDRDAGGRPRTPRRDRLSAGPGRASRVVACCSRMRTSGWGNRSVPGELPVLHAGRDAGG